MSKLKLPGTHRARRPEVTWQLVAPRLAEFGITRVADVTRLDNIGIPVFLAVRPGSETLAVSQGKGATPILAKLSAVMESIELYHAERPDLDGFLAAADDLDLPYGLHDLNTRARRDWIGRIRMPWAFARPVAGGDPVPVPVDAIRLSYSGDHFWRPRILQDSSTGLASGNTWDEACLHGLYEVIERDVLATYAGHRHPARLPVDPTTIDDEHIRSMLDLLARAGVQLMITCIPNRFRVPTFAASVWSPVFPIVCAGSGSHMDTNVALSRAITEAVQSRLTEISTTRDDIPSDLDLLRDSGRSQAPAAVPAVPLAEAVGEHGGAFDDLRVELDTVSGRIHDAVGHKPLVVGLTDRNEVFTVVRTVCPGTTYAEGRIVTA
jgi:ribosomal protein S12 methylthiotransferase accessory factor